MSDRPQQVSALDARDDLLAIAAAWPDLLARLGREGRSAPDGMPKPVSRTTGLVINEYVSEMMAEVRDWTMFLVRQLMDESDWTPPISDRMQAAPVVLETPDRGLTRRLDATERGLAMQATRQTLTLDSRQLDRFWRRVEKAPAPSCWLWVGTIKPNGYGKHSIGQRYFNAHRLAYELVKGAIPEGMDLDHLCRNRACVNPAHLEPVDRRTNLLRGATIPAANAARQACDQGHELDGVRSDGYRYCKTCHREREAARRAAARSAPVDVAALLADIARNRIGFFTAHSDEMLRLAFHDDAKEMRAKVTRVAYPDGYRTLDTRLPCESYSTTTEGGRVLCEGTYTVRPTSTGAEPDLICSADKTHRVPPSEWSRGRWRVRHAGGAGALVRAIRGEGAA